MVKAVAPKPVNFLNGWALGLHGAATSRRWACAGSASAARWPASAMHAFIRTATEIAKDGKFDGFAGLISNPS